ncbi:MAG: NADH-quinone oxidoreductase subunit J [Opitutales bacterium]|jgi:NADH-quinone oxidoreductase subunit J|nr:NADH-quinone oxidoreductase subunit J [Opitutales bacterium]MDP4643491.1 NADH-quinone oxidoreductase subunit J [Opitutales bacterium]MDP4693250.1 NADH-quinone oxidoreductase subunit J [Opitutales bacterium]MDP4778146.1 NADH-quinone oxidoreductase subunit J [Opitutales bacterium]MDP4878434.1 NADH-quinone oxidoreductase subunit J [Opitutales bacterium]
MLDILFYVFAAIVLVSALLMVVSPNAVNGAMCMIVSFVGTAALFVLLEAYFLAILQVLVYAGAVMVLFLFIIMLLDVDKSEGSYFKDKLTLGAAIIGFALVAILVCSAFAGANHLPEPGLMPVLENPTGEGVGIPFTTSSKSFGYSLFSKYMLPFQVTGFLLLAAMIGVIVVSKKHEENS